MDIKTTPIDAAADIKTQEDVIACLNTAFEGGRLKEIMRALGDVARAKGMSEIARKTGLDPQALYTALSENGNPTLKTLLAIVSALDLELTVRKRAA